MQKLDYEALNSAQQVSEEDPFTLERYRQFHRHLPRAATRLLDLGCNTGRGGQVLKSLDPHLALVGLDVVRDRLERIEPGLYEQTLLGDCAATGMEREWFDAIVGGELIEHLDPGDVGEALREWFRLLRLGGRLLLTTPNPGYLRNRLTGASVMDDLAHRTQHFPEMLRVRLMMIGFSHVRVFGSGRVSRYLGERFPLLAAYGSYLITADKR